MGLDSTLLTRRHVLKTAASAIPAGGLLGCARRSPITPPAPVSVFVSKITPIASVSGLLTTFGQQTRVTVTLVGDADAQSDTSRAIAAVASPHQYPGPNVQGLERRDLTSVLKTHNFDPAGILTNIAEGVQDQATGAWYGIPLWVGPLAVRWRTDAFAAAGLPDPSPDWTWEDTQQCCAALQEVVDAHKIDGLRSVLPAMVGGPDTVKANGQIFGRFNPTLRTYSQLLSGFVTGFGGHLVSNGTFAAANDGAVEGLGALATWARTYGASHSLMPATAEDWAAYPSTYAMELQAVIAPAWRAEGVAQYADTWRWARFPRLPVPVVPVQIYGLGVSAHPGVLASAGMDGAGDLLAWLVGAGAQRLLGAGGMSPVANDAAVQVAFWGAQPGGLAQVGDWRHFADPWAGWPTVALPLTDALYGAVEQLVGGGKPLDVLGACTDTMNAWLAANAGAFVHPAH